MTELQERHISIAERRELLRLFLIRRNQIEKATCWIDGELEELVSGIDWFASVLPADEVAAIRRSVAGQR